MNFLGGETRTIRGGDSGADDVECSVGVTPEGVPFFAYLVTCSADDLRALHLDPRLWVVQLGSTSLYPHTFATAFVAPESRDKVSKALEAAGETLSQASLAYQTGELEQLQTLLGQLGTIADEAFVAAAIADDA